MGWFKDIKKSISEFFGAEEKPQVPVVKVVKKDPVVAVSDLKELVKPIEVKKAEEVVTKVEEPVVTPKAKPKRKYKKRSKKAAPKKENKAKKDTPKKRAPKKAAPKKDKK